MKELNELNGSQCNLRRCQKNRWDYWIECGGRRRSNANGRIGRGPHNLEVN